MIKLVTGSKFRATIDNSKVNGKIYVVDGFVYFCHNNTGAKGADSPNKLGYSYSWVVPNVDLVGFKQSCYNNEVTDLVVDGRDLKLSPIYTVAGYRARPNRNKVVFGCGAVSLTKNEITTYFKLNKSSNGATKKELKTYHRITDILKNRKITLSTKDINILKKITK